MTDRERLIESIEHCEKIISELPCGKCKEEHQFLLECLTDYKRYKDLEADGRIIVPPCKVGDTVYVICNKMVQETTVFSMRVETEDKNYVFYIKALAVDGMNKTVHGYQLFLKSLFSVRPHSSPKKKQKKLLQKERVRMKNLDFKMRERFQRREQDEDRQLEREYRQLKKMKAAHYAEDADGVSEKDRESLYAEERLKALAERQGGSQCER